TNSLPAARYGHAMSAWNGRLYVTGGQNSGSAAQSTVWTSLINRDGIVGSWSTEGNSMPLGRLHRAIAVWNGRFYLSGGFNVSDITKATVYSSLIGSDGAMGNWSAESNAMPEGRRLHAMTAWNGQLYVISGIDSTDVVDPTVFRSTIDPSGSVGSWAIETSSLPAGRYRHAVAVCNSRIFVSGGMASGGSLQATVYSATIAAGGSLGEWTTESSSLPVVNNAHEMLCWNSRLYVLGGYNGSNALSSVYSASITAAGSLGTWITESNSLPANRFNPGAAIWNSRLWVTGGSDGTDKSTVYSSSIASSGSVGSWTTESYSLPGTVRGHALLPWNGRLYALGGEDAGSSAYYSGVRYYSSTGTYFSPLIDFGSTITVTSLSWTQSSAPSGSTVTALVALSTSNAMSLSSYTLVANGGSISLPARYLQYRINMGPGGSMGSPPRDESPAISDVTITYNAGMASTSTQTTISPSFSAVNQTSATVGWTSIIGAGFTAVLSANSNFSSIVASGALTSNSTFYTGLSSDTSYYFQVKVSSEIDAAFSLNQISTRTTVDPSVSVSTPGSFAGSALGVSSIVWTWSDVSNETGFRVIDLSSSNLSGDLTVDRSSWTETSLSTNTIYRRRVVAFNGVVAATSSIVSVYTLAAPPTGFAIAGVGVSSVVLQWSVNTNSASTAYRVSYWTLGGSTSTTSSVTVANAGMAPQATSSGTLAGVSITGLSANTSYYFLTAAFNEDGLAAPSSYTVTALTSYDTSIFEPNDSFVQAYGPLTSGTTVEAFISSSRDKDYYSFSVFAGARINAALTSLPDDYDLYLFGPTQSRLAYSIEAGSSDETLGASRMSRSVLSYSVGETGTYYLVVLGYNGAYSVSDSYLLNVTVTGGSASSAKPFGYPSPFSGSIASNIQFVNLKPGEILRIYGMAGFLIKEVKIDSLGAATWTVTDNSGSPVPPGTYIAVGPSLTGTTSRMRVLVLP
ncbi:MAG: fibronectin type III domain-containing protein, partial [Elusimicrobia bacterium]|nr:fibronectin type III domain-containing protein [Elusimicrobiota bacterium]